MHARMSAYVHVRKRLYMYYYKMQLSKNNTLAHYTLFNQ